MIVKQWIRDFLMHRRLGPNVTVMGNSLVSKDSAIGAYSYIGYNCCVTRARIGRYASIANNVSIGLGEHEWWRLSTSSLFYESPYETLTQGECTIGHDVWIGADAIIRRGVTIGDGAVIGANSFVNADVPSFAIVAGSPARVLRYRFPEDVIDEVRQSGWWHLDLEEARTALRQMEASLGAQLSPPTGPGHPKRAAE